MGARTALVWYSIFSTGTDFLGSLYIIIKFGSLLQLNLHECYFETFTSLCHSETSSDVRRDKKWTWLQTMSAEAPPTVDSNIVRVPLAEVKLWLLIEHKSYFRGISRYLTHKKGAHWYPLSRRKEEGQRSQYQESENVTVWWSACPAYMKFRVIFPTWPTLGMVVIAMGR